jgi:hypothetical protein
MPLKKPFPSRFLLLLCIGPFAFLTLEPFCNSLNYHLIPTAAWVGYVYISVPICLLVSIFAAFICLWLHKSPANQRVFVRILSISTILLSLFMLTLHYPSEYRPPYVNFSSSVSRMVNASRIYAQGHDGHYPPHIAALILDNHFYPLSLIDDVTITTPAAFPNPLPPSADWPKYAAEVDAHSIFIYTAADLSDPLLITTGINSLDPHIIIAYTKQLPLVPNHRVVAFTDGHPQLIPDKDLPKTFAASNAARAKLHLPPVTLDGPPPYPPTRSGGPSNQ